MVLEIGADFMEGEDRESPVKISTGKLTLTALETVNKHIKINK